MKIIKSIQTNWLEARAILRLLNRRRLGNALKAAVLYICNQYRPGSVIRHQPLALSIEPTSICNLRCPECPTGINTLKRPRGNMPLVEFERLMNMLPAEVIYLNLYIQGEPTMHPGFPEMVRLAHQKKLYTSTSTNGHFISAPIALKLVKSGLTRIIFSIDGTTQESYETYRIGGRLEKALDGLKHIIKAKEELQQRYPIVVMQFLVFKHNEHQLEAVQALSETLGVDKLEIKTAQFNRYEHTPVSPPQNNKYSRYEKNHQEKLKGQMLNKCWRQWHSAVITWDGKITQCCYDKDADHHYGDLTSLSFAQAWQSKANRQFKTSIATNKKSIDICHNCPEGRRHQGFKSLFPDFHRVKPINNQITGR